MTWHEKNSLLKDLDEMRRYADGCQRKVKELYKNICNTLQGVQGEGGIGGVCEQTIDKVAVVSNGVYVIFKDNSYINWAYAQEEIDKLDKNNVYGVGIVYNGHSFTVELHDLCCDLTPLLTDSVRHITEFIPGTATCIDALFDFDAKANTDFLRKQELYFILPRDMNIPTLGMLAVMFHHKRELNDALVAVGGQPVDKLAYWSCNMLDDEVAAYGINFKGEIFYADCVKSCAYVRPCFEFKP